ncbi:Hvo_1808 family surface protein [Halomicroarcula sp. GCM10025817]|uniref:Hvo_1808 family surface protein n=1 Tax=Haloarcula TaxID=2237 RepID=UPI0023E8D2AE|nr:Hvo_1808 family surface protein [Halomicroarcula sp. SYNS111]
MRRLSLAVALCALGLVLAGCQAPGSPSPSDGASEERATGTPTPETFVLEVETGTTATATETPAASDDPRPDPETDRLGWEAGYWADESLSITTEDGLNETERAAVVARAMARVETIRGLEFEASVPVRVVSRAEYRNRSGGSADETRSRFDNAMFEALFLVGEDEDAIAAQDRQLGASVLGYYSPSAGAIVLVTETATPRISERTLAHELVHALQDQQFGLASDARTRDAAQGRNGLVEGDATTVGARYAERCGGTWDCLERPARGGGGGDQHFGLNVLQYFPYSDGPGLVAALRERGGWAAVNDAYDDPPDSAAEVIDPSRYPAWQVESVDLADRSSDDWARVRPDGRPDYAVVGPSAITASLAYTLTDDYNRSAVVQRTDVVNYENGAVDRTDPYDYDLPATQGWRGGRMHVYASGAETAYVWKTAWATEADASAFAAAWERIVGHWGGAETADGVWVVAEASPFADVVSIRVDGRTVTVVNAPAEDELEGVHDA